MLLQPQSLSKILVAITGASGIIYGVRLIEVLVKKGYKVDAIITRSAMKVAEAEGYINDVARLYNIVKVYDEDDLTAPYASSSGAADAMIIAPCSTKTLAAIAHGYAVNLVVRAALVMLRLKRPLILVIRETPLGVIELRNMLIVARAGAVVLPASPGFYHKPKTIDDLINFVVGKILDMLGIEHKLYKRWGS